MIPAIIPYYKKRWRLHKCKKHLRNQTMPVEIYVVDDSKTASGYTCTVNRGLRYWLSRPCDWDYIVVCDQDMYLDKMAIETMKKFMDSTPRCGIAVCLQRIEGRESFVHGSGLDCYPVGTQLELHISYYEDKGRPIWWGDVACMMVRRECMWDIGILDENFKFICSDSDYTLTARSKGWEIWNPPAGASGVHQRGLAHPITHESSKNNPECKRIMRQMARDAELFAYKWIKAEYYKILRHEPEKPIFIFKDNAIIPSDGQGPEVDKLKEKWIKQRSKRDQCERKGREYVPKEDEMTKHMKSFAKAVGV